MDCDIIRDLLPLYADGLASEASSCRIREHTARCPACKKLLNEMCAPMEPEPEDRTEQIMEMLRRKQWRKTLLTLAAVVLSVIIAVWGFLEIRYSGELIYPSSTNEEKILKKMPELKLTEAELALADTILELAPVREYMESGQESATLDTERMLPELASILPEDSTLTEVFVLGSSIYITIIQENRYTALVYSDIDMTGHIDQIIKTMAEYSRELNSTDQNLGEPDVLCEVIYAVGSNLPQYRQYKTRHMWFSFLDWF